MCQATADCYSFGTTNQHIGCSAKSGQFGCSIEECVRRVYASIRGLQMHLKPEVVTGVQLFVDVLVINGGNWGLVCAGCLPVFMDYKFT